jgi:hypothetical protein
MISMSLEKVDKLKLEVEDKKKEIEVLEGTDIKEIWLGDLDHLLEVLDEVEEEELLEFENMKKLKKN